MESRRKQEFKKGVSAEDGRRRRGETSVQLRKTQKEENLSKRRNLLVNNFVDGETPQLTVGTTPETNVAAVPGEKAKTYTVHDVPQLMEGLKSLDANSQLLSLRGFRRLLSSERNPPVQESIDCGAVPLFVTFLQRNDSPELQFEAAWALTNIASTDRTSLVVECGAVPFLAQQLASSNPDVREQCAWCLGNVAGDGADLRDVVLASGALAPLLANIQQPASLSLLRNCTWALSNFCRGKPQPALGLVHAAIPILAQLLNMNCDPDTMVDAAWALSYISDGDNDRIQAVVDHNVVPVLVNMLQSTRAQTVVPALRTLGNIVTGNDMQTQAVVNANVLPALVGLLCHTKKNVRKEACWMLSNIAAGNVDQVHGLVNTPDLIPKLLLQLSSGAEWDVRKEAAWVVSNISTGGSRAHVHRIVEYGAIRPLCDLLDVGEVRVLLVAMDALDSILKHSGDSNFTKLVDEAEGIEKLENLQEHENQEVYERAVRIIETYFNGEEEEGESENVVPTGSSNTSFSFGIASQPSDSKMFNFGASQQTQQPAFTFGAF
eukprot:gene11890-24914_t